MGKIKTDDKVKSSVSGNSRRNEVVCKEENALSPVGSSAPKKNRSGDVCLKLPKNKLSDDTINLQYATDKGAGVSRTRENGKSNSRSELGLGLRKMMKNEVPENEKEISTMEAKEAIETPNCRSNARVSCSLTKTKSQVTSDNRRINDELSQLCSNEEQPTSKRPSEYGRPLPTVHIQQLNNAESVLFSFRDKYENVERKSAKNASSETTSTDLSEGHSQNCQLSDSSGFREASVKDQSECQSLLAVDNQNPKTFRVKQEHDSNDDHSVHVANVSVVKLENDKASNAVIPVLMKFDEELKSCRRSSNISEESRETHCRKGPTKSKRSNEIVKNAAADDRSRGDVLLVDSSRPKRRPKSDIPSKRSETGDITCSMSTPIKRELSVEDNVVFSMHETIEVEASEFVRDSSDKKAKTSSKHAGAKAAKKTRPAKSKQSTSTGSASVSPSILTRSMIKIPG